jgi:hypothetical protein
MWLSIREIVVPIFAWLAGGWLALSVIIIMLSKGNKAFGRYFDRNRFFTLLRGHKAKEVEDQNP